MKLPPKTNPTSVVELTLASMTPAERARGRFMRAPDGHDAGAAAVAPDLAAAAAADAGTGGEGGDGGQGNGNDADGGDDTTFLGGAGSSAGEGGEGSEGAADKGEAGEGGDAPVPAGAPEKYELTAPEGMEFDTAAFEAAEPVLRELGLSNEQAQKLVSAYGEKIVPQITERVQQGFAAQAAQVRKEWADAFEADPEIGGARKTETQNFAARAFDHYGLKAGEGLRQLLDESGIGNHPDLIRFVARVGRDLDEGNFERGDPVTVPKTPEQKLYGEAFQPQQ